jgi:hypothetical protein
MYGDDGATIRHQHLRRTSLFRGGKGCVWLLLLLPTTNNAYAANNTVEKDSFGYGCKNTNSATASVLAPSL